MANQPSTQQQLDDLRLDTRQSFGTIRTTQLEQELTIADVQQRVTRQGK